MINPIDFEDKTNLPKPFIDEMNDGRDPEEKQEQCKED